MPIQMNYDFLGASFTESYWVLVAINLNTLNKSATLVFHGFTNKAAFDDAPDKPLDVRIFVVNDPDVYDQHLSPAKTLNVLYTTQVESYVIFSSPSGFLGADSFFAGGMSYSPVEFVSAEIGNEDNLTVTVTFGDDLSAVSDASGVTILVNGSSAGIASAARVSANHAQVQYTLTAAVNVGDVVTFAYDSGHSLADSYGAGLPSITPQSVTNNIGAALQFNIPDNSAHFVLLFG